MNRQVERNEVKSKPAC